MNNTYYKQTRISVEEFKKMLGEDGSITVYTQDGEVIGYINKNSVEVNNEYVITYPNQYNTVRFEITNIKEDGEIIIKNDKAIKKESDFSREQISIFSTINTMTTVNLYKGEEVKTYQGEGNINLEETESRMIIGVDTPVLSVEGKNELAINVTLKTDEERYDLFENPTVDIEFPSSIEEVEVTGISLLYKNGLTIENWEIETNEIGKKVIRVKFSGAQSEYTPGSLHEGTTLVLYTEVGVNRLTADSKDVLKMTYTNKDTVRKTYSLEGKESEDIEVGFVGREELVRAMEITEADVATATSYDDEAEKIEIQTNKEQTINVKGSIINNYEATLNDVVIIGRIPFVGNKDGNGNDLGTNFDTELQSGLATAGVVADVYYSEDGTAEAESDSWTQDMTNQSKFKSYKIVIREKTLAKGERLSFEYSLRVPEEVGYNAVGYTNYVVHYKIDTQDYMNQCSVGMYTEEKEIELGDIEEKDKQEFPELTIGTQVSQGGKILGETDSVYERQILKYTVVVRNTSDKTINNVVVKGKAENSNIYDWEYIDTPEGYFENIKQVRIMKEYSQEEKENVEFTIESLSPEESKTFEYQVIVRDLSEIENSEVYGNILVSVDGYDDIEVNTFKNKIEEGKLEVRLSNTSTESVNNEDNITNISSGLAVDIKNISDRDLENVKYIVNIPSEVSVYDSMISFSNDDTNIEKEELVDKSVKLIFTIPVIKSGECERVVFYVKNNSMEYTKLSTVMTILSYAEYDGEIYNANDYTKRIYQGETKLEYNLTSDVDKEYVENGDEIVFTLNTKNVGFAPSEIINAIANIPSGLEVIDVNFENKDSDDYSDIDDKKIDVIISSLNENEEENLKIVTKVNENLFEKNQSTIEFGVDINYPNQDMLKTNVISYKINNNNVTTYLPEVDDNSSVDYVIEDKDSNQEEQNQENNEQNNNEENNNQENNQENNQQKPEENNQPQSNTNNEQQQEQVQPEVKEEPVAQTYSISGLAWIDRNQDGIRQDEEKLKEEVAVSLYKSNNNGGIDTTKLVGTTTTDTNGKYIFENVENGNYIITFDYNSERYKVTKYQVKTAKSTENSDAVSKIVTINGNTETLGVTDVLTVENMGLTSIDIGIIDTTNYDFSLEKNISEIKVRNEEGTKVYNYEDGNNKRIEIRSKYYKGTVLDITYKFKVKNEGDISGYINKVVDYLPEGVQVVLNSSEGWYIGSDNGLYYTGLVDQEIASGEEREFTLVIRKSLENGESVKLVNGAEIIESTNSQGLLDRDSKENNKVKTEDDYGEITLTVSVATGHTLEYITTTLITIIMFGVITVMIMKFIKTKKIYR